MDSSFWFDTINFGQSILNIERSYVKFPNKIVFLSLKIILVISNRKYPDESKHISTNVSDYWYDNGYQDQGHNHGFCVMRIFAMGRLIDLPFQLIFD